MVEQINLLLSEYEQLTGRSPTWREDISIGDFLKLRDYAKKSSFGQIETSHTINQPVTNVIKKEFKQADSDREISESTSNTIPFASPKKNESKQSAVDILKGIKD